MIDERQALAIQHFRRHMHKAPNWAANLKGPWQGLSDEEKAEDILTADWVPNRRDWRSRGLRGRQHALEVL